MALNSLTSLISLNSTNQKLKIHIFRYSREEGVSNKWHTLLQLTRANT